MMNKKWTATLMTLGLFASASVALGDDVKIHNGSACQGLVSGVTEPVYKFPEGIATAHQTAWVTCPIVRDIAGSTSGLRDLDVRVSNGGGQVKCTGYSLSKWGSVLRSVVRSTTSTGNRNLNWGTSLNTGEADGSYSIICELPTNSWLHTYRSNEA